MPKWAEGIVLLAELDEETHGIQILIHFHKNGELLSGLVGREIRLTPRKTKKGIVLELVTKEKPVDNDG